MTNKLELVWPGKGEGYALIRDKQTGEPRQVAHADVQPRLLTDGNHYGSLTLTTLPTRSISLATLLAYITQATQSCLQRYGFPINGHGNEAVHLGRRRHEDGVRYGTLAKSITPSSRRKERQNKWRPANTSRQENPALYQVREE